MAPTEPPSTFGWTSLGVVAVLCFFCVPLFLGLKGLDLRSDEAIYSYAVDRILETGDWLTPRLIAYDLPFLEKPPLKLWIVAGAIREQLLPHDEFGYRFVDALFGAIAFIYVFALGRSLSGSLCGFVAVLVLFTLDSLLFEHGLRENQMEAALLLSYCGGIYHFNRWVDGSSKRSAHAVAVGAYFTLGFMTKFVAVLFMPLVCGIAVASQRDWRQRSRSRWRDWVVPIVLTVALITPWFLYQTMHAGSALWKTMFGAQVFTRFTGVLDPRHQQPWHHYFSQTWAELTLAGSQWISSVGVLMLAVKAWSGRPTLARLLLIWWIVPFALMSIGTSKLFHYAYPFLPPIALGAGVVADALFRAIERRIASTAAAVFRSVERGSVRRLPLITPWFRQLLVVGAACAVGLAIWTAVAGRIRWEINGFALLRNTSVSRPVFVAVVLFVLAGHARILSRALALAVVALVLPVSAYTLKIERLQRVNHPLRTLRDCAAPMRESHAETHVYPPYEQLLNHSYRYYLRQVGPWVEHAGSPTNDELQLRLFAPGQQRLVILYRRDYDTFEQHIAIGDARPVRFPIGLALSEELVLLTPGPFEACGAAALAAGGKAISEVHVRGTL